MNVRIGSVVGLCVALALASRPSAPEAASG